MKSFIATQTLLNEEFRNQNLLTNETLRKLDTKVDNIFTHAKMLETKISQVAQQQAASSAPSGSFPKQPKQNSKVHVSVVTNISEKQVENSRENDNKVEESSYEKKVENPPTPLEKEVVKEVEKETPYVDPPPYKPLIPFQQRVVEDKVDTQSKVLWNNAKDHY